MPSHPASVKYEFKIQILSPSGTSIGTSEPFKATRAKAQRQLLAVLRKGFKSKDHAIIFGGKLIRGEMVQHASTWKAPKKSKKSAKRNPKKRARKSSRR